MFIVSIFTAILLKSNGGSCSVKNELKPLTVLSEYSERWVKERVDSLELARLRDSGLTLREIGARVGVAKTTVLRSLRLHAEKEASSANQGNDHSGNDFGGGIGGAASI